MDTNLFDLAGFIERLQYAVVIGLVIAAGALTIYVKAMQDEWR